MDSHSNQYYPEETLLGFTKYQLDGINRHVIDPHLAQCSHVDLTLMNLFRTPQVVEKIKNYAGWDDWRRVHLKEAMLEYSTHILEEFQMECPPVNSGYVAGTLQSEDDIEDQCVLGKRSRDEFDSNDWIFNNNYEISILG